MDAKPLPSPPVAEVMNSSPLRQNRSLIDASEKPLRRSPPGKPQEEEEWPVLYPARPTTPGTLMRMTSERDGVLATSDKPYHQAERYPRLPSQGSYEPTSGVEKKQDPKVASNHQIQRKKISSPNLRTNSPATKHAEQTNKENNRPGTTLHHSAIAPNIKPSSPVRVGKQTSSSMSSTYTSDSAVQGERLAPASKPAMEPRQTRTSSLRARLSAGAVKDSSSGNNQALGHTDISTTAEPPATEKDSKHRSTPKPPGAYPLAPKPSKDSLRGKKPAQFVAGSRRATSRGSLRSESRASAISTQTQPLETVSHDHVMPSVSRSVEPSLDAASNTDNMAPEIAPRKSSIPVFRHTVSDIVTQADQKIISEETKSSELTSNASSSHDQFLIFEDSKESQPFASLDAIEESPRQGYHVRRLSVMSPEHGPTLKISPSADRIIMGTGSDKENDEPKKKSKSNRRALTPLEIGSSSKDKQSTTARSNRPLQGRPSSSHGLLQSTSRRGTVDSESRAKKARSAEIGSSPTLTRFSQLSTTTQKPSRKNTETSIDDPFYDAQSSIEKRSSRLSAPDHRLAQHEGTAAIKEPEWVAPVQKHLGLTADSDAMLNPSDVQSMMTHDENAIDSVTADILSMISHDDRQDASLEATQPGVTKANHAAVEPQADETIAKNISTRFSAPSPATPEQSGTAAGSSRSGSLPPRSSSRTTHPDFISNKHTPTSPLGNKENVPEAFTERQNRLGSLRGHGTSQIDYADPTNRNSTRSSVARESNKSQGSVSKGMLSNIKGLFHKRSADEPIPGSNRNGKKHKQHKASVTANGSPFPPISEIHPVHRPTLSSARRSNARGPKSLLPEIGTHAPPTPAFNSPAPSELATTTTMAMQILESARRESSSPKKERLLEVGKILVDAITQARDAEKAFEEAKHAARKAEISYELCKRSVSDVKKVVEQWRDEIARDSSR